MPDCRPGSSRQAIRSPGIPQGAHRRARCRTISRYRRRKYRRCRAAPRRAGRSTHRPRRGSAGSAATPHSGGHRGRLAAGRCRAERLCNIWRDRRGRRWRVVDGVGIAQGLRRRGADAADQERQREENSRLPYRDPTHCSLPCSRTVPHLRCRHSVASRPIAQVANLSHSREGLHRCRTADAGGAYSSPTRSRRRPSSAAE